MQILSTLVGHNLGLGNLGKGIEPIKVMSMGGWKDLKTIQIYIRKAGVNIKGITNTLDLHDPTDQRTGRVISLQVA